MKNLLPILVMFIFIFPSLANSKDYFFTCPEKYPLSTAYMQDNVFEFHIEDNYFFDKAFYKLSPSDRWTEATNIEISKREFIIHDMTITFGKYLSYVVIDRATSLATFYAALKKNDYKKHDQIWSKQCYLNE